MPNESNQRGEAANVECEKNSMGGGVGVTESREENRKGTFATRVAKRTEGNASRGKM